MIHFLVHDTADTVGIAVVDIVAGMECAGRDLSTNKPLSAIGTNPIAASFPTGKDFTVKIDLATSTVARGNVIAAQKKNAAIPLGWALDRNGDPTTDVGEALLGTVLTMAGHKGYALALMVELFSSVLSGSAIGREIGSMYKNMESEAGCGAFLRPLSYGGFPGLCRISAPNRLDHRLNQVLQKAARCRRNPHSGRALRKAGGSSAVGGNFRFPGNSS
jgi:LDH2 family malate/lactate/ureidoglycolate dehydrogenase